MKPRLIPESLFGRFLLALLGAVGVTLIVIIGLLLKERGDRLFSASETAAVVETIAGAARELGAQAGTARAEALERLRATPPVLSTGQRPTRGAGPDNFAAVVRLLRARLARELGDDYAVQVRPARPGPPSEGRAGAPRPGPPFGPRELDITVRLPDADLVTFRIDTPRAPPPLPAGLLLELGLLTALLAGVLFVMARSVTKPLGDLASAADAVGRGERFAPLTETGARELRNATRAFNTMQERLHRYLDSRTRVLAAMSHDLRTPLTRLKLRVESIDDAALAERFNADLDEMSRMVNGALNVFKGLNHDEPLSSFRLDALLEELRGEFVEQNEKVVVESTAALPVRARRDALKRCLANLVANAIKYGGNAVVRVEENGGDVVVRVQDDGPGIPENLLEQVFEPFFRLETSRSTDTGGIGLGLGIARDVAQAHGGSLTLRNRTPHGLEAVLRLPRSPA
jgi:signal transduction histidine kinase